MAIIAVFSGSFCQAEDVVEAVCRSLLYERLDPQIWATAAARWNVPEDKLHRAVYGGSSSLFAGKYPKERDRLLACLKITLLEAAGRDNVLCHGLASLFWDRAIAHVLRVCLIAPADYRLAQAIRELNISAKEAHKRVHKDDEICSQWTQRLFHQEPWDASLFDILIPMNSVTVNEAAGIIVENAGKTAVQTTPQSRQALRDALLAAQVNLAIIEKGEGLDVTCSEGAVRIEINKPMLRVETFEEEVRGLASAVLGVRSVEFAIGSHFRQPAIIRDIDLEVPSKVLLVDDEQEFVQTLSERLQTRHMEPMVAYDGEEALSRIASDEPEVMVLDLKMPGIDGLEVLRRVKKEHPHVEVIILTGHGSDKEEALALELGAFAYLKKPVNIEVLTKTMKEAYQRISQKKAEESS